MSSNPIQFNALARALKLADPIKRKKASRRELNRILKALEPPRLNLAGAANIQFFEPAESADSEGVDGVKKTVRSTKVC